MLSFLATLSSAVLFLSANLDKAAATCPEGSVNLENDDDCGCYFRSDSGQTAALAGDSCTDSGYTWIDGSDVELVAQAIETIGIGTVWTSAVYNATADAYLFPDTDIEAPVTYKSGKECAVYSKKGGWEPKDCNRTFDSLCVSECDTGVCPEGYSESERFGCSCFRTVLTALDDLPYKAAISEFCDRDGEEFIHGRSYLTSKALARATGKYHHFASAFYDEDVAGYKFFDGTVIEDLDYQEGRDCIVYRTGKQDYKPVYCKNANKIGCYIRCDDV